METIEFIEFGISSDDLRGSDGVSFHTDSNISPELREKINRALEQNYQRGFQQGIHSVKNVMEELSLSVISRSFVGELSSIAGKMRSHYKGRKKYSYFHYSDVFSKKVIEENKY